MATEFSMTGIMNAALLEQGLDEINESQSLPEQRVLSRNWPLIVEAELEDGHYHFTKDEKLLQDRTVGRFGYDDAYLIPGGALHVRKVRVEEASGSRWEPEWVQDDRYVYVSSPNGVVVEWIKVPDVTFWTANFSRGIQMRLEAVLLRSVKEEYRNAETMDQKAEAQLQRARTNSSKARSAKDVNRPGRLVRARLGRG